MTPLLTVTPALTASAAAPAVHMALLVLLQAPAALPVLLLLRAPATFLRAPAALPVLLLGAPATL
jgi:hypothetical protein